jgi:hypothetical protein
LYEAKACSVLIAERFCNSSRNSAPSVLYRRYRFDQNEQSCQSRRRALKQILILCRATKAQGKVTGNFHYTPTSTTRNYYDEEIIDRDGPLSFTNFETQYAKVFSKTLLTGFQLVSIL